MIKELQQAKENWEKERDWKRGAIPSVWNYHKEWCEKYPIQTRYIAEIQDYILSKENIPTELHDQLHTEIYLANAQENKIKKDEYKQKMLSEGWLELNEKVEYRGKIELRAKYTSDWATNNIEKQAKISESNDGELFIVPKGKRSRGWYVRNLENAFYKKIN